MERIRVIIVDDDPMVCQGLGVLIPWEQYDFQIVSTFCEAPDALEYLESHPVELVITDIKMPRINGIKLIETIRRRGISCQILILSGYDEYEYLRRAINFGVVSYLMKPVNVPELLANIKTVRDRFNRGSNNLLSQEGLAALKDSLFQRIIRKQIEKPELRNKLEFLRLSALFEWPSYRVGLFQPDQVILDRLPQIEKSSQGPISWIYFFDSEQKLVFLTCSLSTLEEILAVRQLHGAHLYIGAPVTDLTAIAISYCNAWESMFKGICLSVPQGSKSPWQEMREQGDTLHLRTILQALIRQQEDLQIAKERLFSALFTIARELQKGEYSHPEDLGFSLHFLRTASSHGELEERIDSICAAIEVCWKRKSLQTGNQAVDAVLYYIQSHLAEGISLSIISHELQRNPSYLGKLFYQVTGQKFTEYVQKERISKACKLLGEPCLKVADIAQKCGFHDYQYFLKVFSDLRGCTPSEYRRKIESRDFPTKPRFYPT